MSQKTIVVVDDHKIMRDGLKALFKRSLKFTIVADYDNEDDLFLFLEGNTVDVVLMDIHLPVSNGLDIAKKIKGLHPGIKVIMHTMSEDMHNVEVAKSFGAEGFVLKNFGQKELEKALDEITCGGGQYYSL